MLTIKTPIITRLMNYKDRKYTRNCKEAYPFPLSLDIEASGLCNLRCKMCPTHSATREKKIMSFDLFKKIIDEGVKNELNSIYFVGHGEPLLNQKIVEMVEYAHKKGIYTGITSNGMLLKEELAEQLVHAGINYFFLSIDGATAKTYEKIRIGGKYSIVEQNITNLLSYIEKNKLKRPTVHISCILMLENKSEINEFKQKWGKYETIITNFKTYIKPLDDWSKKINIAQRFRNPVIMYLPCTFFDKRLCVYSTGQVVACCKDSNADIVVGDLNKESIKDIWTGQLLNDVRTKHAKLDFSTLSLCKRCAWSRKDLINMLIDRATRDASKLQSLITRFTHLKI